MSSIAIIRSQVERRIPGALTIYERPVPEVFSAGISAMDSRNGRHSQGRSNADMRSGWNYVRQDNSAVVFAGASHRQRAVLRSGGRFGLFRS